jgi:hypothetical protein
VNAHGEPHAWHHLPLPGLRDGFPLVIELPVGEARLRALRHAVEDGNYWDDLRSEELAVEVLSFSAAMAVFAYVRMQFTLYPDGSIRCVPACEATNQACIPTHTSTAVKFQLT